MDKVKKARQQRVHTANIIFVVAVLIIIGTYMTLTLNH